MPRHNHHLPAGANASWTDMLPPTSSPSSSPPPSPPRRRPCATPSMLARISKLRSGLTEIKASLNARRHIQLLHSHRGSYCLHCSPQHLIGACGPTCPLLCPHSSGSEFRGTADSETWQRHLLSDSTKYRELVSDINARGEECYASTVARWERSVEKLNRGCMSPTEWHDREGWREMTPRNRVKVTFKEGWGFEGAWGKGPDIGVEIAPGVVAGMTANGKRKRGGNGTNGAQDEGRKRARL